MFKRMLSIAILLASACAYQAPPRLIHANIRPSQLMLPTSTRALTSGVKSASLSSIRCTANTRRSQNKWHQAKSVRLYATPTLVQTENAKTGTRDTGTASFLVSTLNLIKNCVGAGVFSLSYRMMSISPRPETIYPASALIILMALWAAHNFDAVGKTCEMTGTSTFGEAWEATISKDSRWIVQTVVTVAPIVSCLANVIVLTDILGLIARSLGAPVWLHGNRDLVIALLGTFVLFPLCTMKDLSALKSISVIGIGGHLSAMAAVAFRLKDKSYLPGGAFYTGSLLEAANVAAAKVSQAQGTKLSAVTSTTFGADISKWFVLASLLSYCFVSHYNAPKYFSELRGKEDDSTLFPKMATTAYLTTASIYIGTIALSLGLWGRHSASFALNNFSPRDPLGLVARIAFGTSVLASFPLIFLAMRNFFVQQAEIHLPKFSNMKGVSAALLGFICLCATKCKDIGIVGSISGGIFGSSMMFVFPPLMYINALKRRADKTGTKLPTLKILFNVLLLFAGTGLGCLGTINSILSTLKK